MRKGLLDVLPKNSLEDLTAEDFRLLVNGCGEVNVQMLISFTSFNDESGMKFLNVLRNKIDVFMGLRNAMLLRCLKVFCLHF